tara:strand:- start:63 stop:536 length:474 start_codon:yes stop_codon:yes gene_type:complete
MAYTPFKMKGPSLYRNMSATKMSHKSATKNIGDKPKDINKNNRVDDFEQARFDAIKANSPANYGTMKSPTKGKGKYGGYESHAQRKAKHATDADGGKGAPKYKSPNKVVLDEVKVTGNKKKVTGRKKIETSLANRKKGLQGYEVTYDDGTKSKVLSK